MSNRALLTPWTHNCGRMLVALAVGLLFATELLAADITGFKAISIDGKCKVKVGDNAYEAIELNRQYPFGCMVKTGRNSKAVLEFSTGNTFQLLARTTLRINEDTKNPKLKILKLDGGSVSLKLDDFPKDHKLQVETPSAICGAVGTRFVVSFDEDDAATTKGSHRFECDKGEIMVASSFDIESEAVAGKSFSIPSMTAGSALVATIHEGLENSYTDVTVNRGSLSFDYGGSKSQIRVTAKDGQEARFVCSLEKSDASVSMFAMKVEQGTVQRVNKRFLGGESVTDIDAGAEAVTVQGNKVYTHSGTMVADYIAASKREGEIHSNIRAMKAAGAVDPAKLAEEEAKLRSAASEATKLRSQLLSKRTRKIMRLHRRAIRMRR